MAGSSTPLLSDSDSASKSETTPKLQKHLPSLDDAIEQCVGESRKSQLCQALLVSCAWIFDAQQTFISIFADAVPKWHCTPLAAHSCNSSASATVCQLPDHSWAWDLPPHASTLSEWSLECSGSVVSGLPASSFFVGCLVGGLALSTLADSVGRKKTLFLSCFLMSFTGMLTALSPNVWVYSALKFVAGVGRSTIGSCVLVLSTETVGKRWRGHVGVLGFLCFTLGFLSLPAIAFINRGSSWRVLYVYTSFPTLFYCILIHFCVRESPRWLFVQGRREEAVSTLKSIAAPSPLTMSFSGVVPSHDAETFNFYSSLKILLQKRWAMQRLSASMAVGFGVGVVYYGMPLAVGNLPFNLYLSVTFNALAEIPSSLATIVLIERLNRRSGVLLCCGLTGICSVACAWAKGPSAVGLELVSFFSGCTACNMVQIFAIELFPTCVRNSAMTMLRQAIMFGGVFGPVIVSAGRANRWLSYGVFGVVTGCCGLLAVCLPETRGRTLSDTIDEEEQKNASTRAAISV
ncbi:organic cation/carnitine transporter 3-like [Malania oleifera]|uniref:organic cation/carnitine transporter 3-like n=1 Tax=Malania oleifera TaxID=397392 RepID=UPI0025AE013F|nr:organic cation/carnitine transporter 3-like [Malania oleifera]